MNVAVYPKEPTAVTDYEIDWSDWLNGRTISTSTWALESGLTNQADSHTSTTTLIRISGGAWTQELTATNTITTNTSETEVRSITLQIRYAVVYFSTEEFRRRATQATDNAIGDAELEALVEQASRTIDLICGVSEGYFNGPLYGIATSQIVYGDGTNYLRLPPYVPGSLSATITVPTGYTAPDFVERGGYLIISSNGVLATRFAPYPSTVNWYQGVPYTISAIWGFLATPESVKEAAIELAINLWRETDPASLKLTNLDGQPLRENLPPRVKELAKHYRMRNPAFI